MSDNVPLDWIVGLDLGTTNTCVAAIRLHSEKPEVLANREGARTTPSYVSFVYDEESAEPLVGQAAKDKASSAPELTIHDNKRLIGRRWLDPHVQKHLATNVFGCEVVDDGTGHPAYQIMLDGVATLFSPVQIASIQLKNMKEIVEERFFQQGQRIVKTVIGVPAHFNESQRKATLEAAKQAGLPNVELVAEPSAAAFAYGLDSGRRNGYNVLVYDFGGGTFDVSLLRVANGQFEVLSKDGDDELGGGDITIHLRDDLLRRIRELIDERLAQHCSFTQGVSEAALFRSSGEQRTRLLRKCDHPQIQHRLLKEAEEMKMALSRQSRCSLYLPCHGFDDIAESIDVTKGDFEAIDGVHSSLFRTIEIVRTALREARLHPSQIDVIILVGGSSRIPRVRQMLEAEFSIDGTTHSNRIKDSQPNPDESVAYGAALYGLQLVREMERQRPNSAHPRLFETTALGISVETLYGRCQTIIAKGERIPVRGTHRFTTVSNDQPNFVFELFEGASLFTAKCNRLADLELRIPSHLRGAAGTVSVDVTLELDSNGILHVSASLGELRSQIDVDYANLQSRRPHRPVHEMLAEAQAEHEDELTRFKRLSMLVCLETRISAVRYQLDRLTTAPTQAQREARQKCVLVEKWLSINKATANYDQLEEKCAELGEPF